MGAETAQSPHHLLEDGFAVETCELLVIGCGNILRGDDAAGPVLIRRLHERGVPAGVRLVDGGTAGMDVAFAMRGASRVLIVDASRTGAEPGTVYRIPAHELTDLPTLDGLHAHNFRWDHALSFGDWLLGPDRPQDVTVLLVEAASTEPGAELTAPVAAGVHRVIELIESEFWPTLPAVPDPPAGPVEVEITSSGCLQLPAALAAERFPADVLVASADDRELVLLPLVSPAYGGLVLNCRNPAGDRSVLIHQVLGFDPVCGRFSATWDGDRGALVIDLTTEADGAGDRDGGAVGAGPVVGLSGGAGDRGDPASAADHSPHRGAGPAGSRPAAPDRRPAAPLQGRGA